MVVHVGVRDLRSNLSSWLDRVRDGDEVVITERGQPVARIVGYDRKSKLQELIDAGIVTPARRPKQPIDTSKLVRPNPGKTISDILIDQRRSARY